MLQKPSITPAKSSLFYFKVNAVFARYMLNSSYSKYAFFLEGLSKKQKLSSHSFLHMISFLSSYLCKRKNIIMHKVSCSQSEPHFAVVFLNWASLFFQDIVKNNLLKL